MKVPMLRGSSALWLFLSTYALLYGAFGVQSPFVPALLSERGLSAEDIGLVLAAAMVVRVLVGLLVSHAADRLRRHAAILCGCALFAALATVSFLFGTQLRWPALRRAPSCRYAGADCADHRCAGFQGSAGEPDASRTEV